MDPCFSHVLDQWLVQHGSQLKHSSRSTYSAIADTHLRPYFGPWPMEQLTPEMIEGFFRERDGTVAPSTLRGIASVLRQVLSFAQTEGLSAPERLPRQCVPPSPRKESRILTERERIRLEAVLQKGNDPCRLGTLLCLYTGLRLGELCALRWGDISLERGLLTVRHTIQRVRQSPEAESRTTLLFDRPKSDSSARTIPLPGFMTEMLRGLEKEPGCFLLSGRPDTVVEPRTMQNRFKRYLQEADVDDINFHALRHTFATRCVALGFDVKVLSRILGHSDVSITLNVYVHPSLPAIREYMDRLTLS